MCRDDVPPTSADDELKQDLIIIIIITVFSACLYGKHRHGFRKKVTDVIREHHTEIKE